MLTSFFALSTSTENASTTPSILSSCSFTCNMIIIIIMLMMVMVMVMVGDDDGDGNGDGDGDNGDGDNGDFQCISSMN